uniref:RNA methyltransferase n=1 Tax=Ningiella ruwaisensis TaxID=2364274 RepID=UPI00109FE51C|nr:RNA methyltransferase [Ningiella ruwaisensis]
MTADDLVSIGLVNPKSATNVAAILRAAGCYGVKSVFYSGQRFRYAKDHVKNVSDAALFRLDTKNMRAKIPLVGVDNLLTAVPKDATPVVVELAERAIPLPEFTHPANAFYIFGPEDASVPKDIVSQINDVVYIPTFGSMNLAATANVVLYDRLSKRDYPHSSDFIKRVRDNKNNL